MKNDPMLSAKIDDAMTDFARHLPDADKCFHSTIINEIQVEQKKIIFKAQKRKGNSGMCWDIRYKTVGADGEVTQEKVKSINNNSHKQKKAQ